MLEAMFQAPFSEVLNEIEPRNWVPQPRSQGLSSLPPCWSLEERPWLRLVT